MQRGHEVRLITFGRRPGAPGEERRGMYHMYLSINTPGTPMMRRVYRLKAALR